MIRLIAALALVVTACDRDAPPAPSAAEAERLDEAENLLNDMGNEKGAEPFDPAPNSVD